MPQNSGANARFPGSPGIVDTRIPRHRANALPETGEMQARYRPVSKPSTRHATAPDSHSSNKTTPHPMQVPGAKNGIKRHACKSHVYGITSATEIA